MINSSKIDLEAKRICFFSQRDEEAFFEWLNKLKCVESYTGQGEILYITINGLLVDEDALRELIALFHRYDIDAKQLCLFDCDQFSDWFRDSRAYWFSAVFGENDK